MHGMEPHEEIEYWRNRAERAEAMADLMRAVCDAAIEWKRVADDPGAPVWKYTMKLDAAIAALRSVGKEPGK